MWAICIKEIRQFFASLTGIIAIVVFLLLNGLFLFVFPDSSLLEYGYATLEKYFELAPWVLTFLVPAITMRSFSDEFKAGTFEVLQTRPLSAIQIITGKYLGSLLIVVLSLLPTVLYAYTIHQLSAEQAGLDLGGTIGSYFGLLCLGALFTAIGICCSSFTANSVAAFIISAFVCFLLYSGFSAVSKIEAFSAGADYYIELLGIQFHYNSLSRGVIDSRDVIYFLSFIYFFLYLTRRNLLQFKP